MKTKKRVSVMMKKMFNVCLIVVFMAGTLMTPPRPPSTYAEDMAEAAEVVNSINPQTTPAVDQKNKGVEVDKLLGKYFKRIDAYLKESKYRMAKNELKKVYLIDPNNPKAKKYATLIEKNTQEKLKIEEADHAQKEALMDAERSLRRKRETRTAFERLKEKRIEEAWTQEGAYVRPSEVDLDEFERLQTLGIDKYKDELIKEARRYLKQDNYDKAISRYKDALAVDPGDMIIRELLNEVQEAREERMDGILRAQEKIEDRQFMEEVTKASMGIDDYRRGMQGAGYAKPHVGYKPKKLPVIYDKLQIPITADFRDVDLVSVLNFLADYTGINIIPSQIITTESRLITVRFKELPLERALKYIIKGQGLTYRIDDDLIYVATVDEMENEELETRIYYLEKGSGVFTTYGTSFVGSYGSSGGSASVSGIRSIRDLIEEAVSFPPGAKIVFDERTGALIITNTPSNLDRIEEILSIVDEPPQQILIESRFIEVNVDEAKNIGVQTDVDSRVYLDTEKDIGLDITNLFTGVSSAVDSSNGGQVISLTGLLTDPQFSMVLNALERLDKTKTLSAPKITTINNQTATIKVVTEEVFPTRFEVSLIQQDLNGDGDLDDAGETEFANVPQEFVSRDVGIILQVTPSVGIDKKTITLSIIPEVSTVAATPARFPITTLDTSGAVDSSSSSGTPDLPRFTTSTLSTTVVLESGETAVLGGLMQETLGTTVEKVPILGDIPLIGFFFRSTQDDIDRTNLVIFITARVISA